MHPDDLGAVRRALGLCLTGDGDTPYVSEHRLRHSEGHYVWVADRGQVVERNPDDTPARMVGAVKNIDERKRYEAEIHRLAFYDALTGLPNRRLLHDRLDQAFIRNGRNGTQGALLFLDMDRFKALNDSHGHAMGDRLLVEVARRLTGAVRQQDTVARLGGDEFVIMLESMAGPADTVLANARAIGHKILTALNQPYDLGGLTYSSTPSIGLALFEGNPALANETMRRADIAMYSAKANGRNNLKLYDPAMEHLGPEASSPGRS